MSRSTLLYARQVMDVFRVRPVARASAPPEAIAPPRPAPRRAAQPTMFQRCLAVHMFAAERASALD
jgi:hypothetical protein